MQSSYYRYHMFFCTNQRPGGEACCQQHDAQAMRDYAKKRTKELGLVRNGEARVNTAGCMNRCQHGPVVVIYPEAVWYTWSNQEDIEEIIQSHLLKGEVVERLKI